MDDGVYPPDEDTFLLLEVSMREVKSSDEVLEVGTGSGLIAEKLRNVARFVVGTDISPYAVREARKRGIEVVRTDIARGLKKKFSLIIFNPPYLPLDDEEKRGDWLEKALDGGKEGREIILRFLKEIKENLAENGRILLLISSLSGVDGILSFAEKHGYVFEKIAEKKLFFERLEIYRLGFESSPD